MNDPGSHPEQLSKVEQIARARGETKRQPVPEQPSDTPDPALVASVVAALQAVQGGGQSAADRLDLSQVPYTPPTQNGAARTDVIDLDAQLDLIDTSPQPVRLGGHVYRVRRDFTPRGVAKVLQLASKADGSPEAERTFWAELVGENDAQRIQEYTAELEQVKITRVVAQLAAAAGIQGLAGGGQGE